LHAIFGTMRVLHSFVWLVAVWCCFALGAESFAVHPATSRRLPRALSAHVSAAQLLEFEEPQTGVKVILVGAMHYNPASIQLAKKTIETLGNEDRLGSVVVEACDIRWNKTAELYKDKPFLKQILNNEMRTACDSALAFDRPVVLGDQRINITVDALKGSFKQTMNDLVTPPAGWKRFADEVRSAWSETVPFGGDGFLNAFAFFDPRLLLVLPVSLVKYPLSYFVRDPIPTSVGLSILGALSFLDDPTSLDALIADDSISIADWMISFGFAALETAIFARLLLKPLLAERNEILAQSILDQCRIYAGQTVGKPATVWSPLDWLRFGRREASLGTTTGSKTSSTITYAPGSPPLEKFAAPINNENNKDKVVVAVLGMAHCNGIKRILCGPAL